MIKRDLLFVLLVLMALGACGGSTTDSADEEEGSDSDDESTELTLASCTTNVSSDLPEFYRTYFKCVLMNQEGGSVVIDSAALPPHRSYYYGQGDPNFEEFDTSRGDEYSPNPNRIESQTIHLGIPLDPTTKGLTITESMVDGIVGNNDDEYGLGAVGVALDSVALFNPLAAPGDDIENEKFTFDDYNSHPTGTGAYHYHTNSKGPLEVLQSLGFVTTTTLGSAEIEFFGILCDGTVVLGCTELNGAVPDDSDFDPQNGHVHNLTDASGTVMLGNRYHTHICPNLFPDHQFTPEIQFYSSCVRE